MQSKSTYRFGINQESRSDGNVDFLMLVWCLVGMVLVAVLAGTGLVAMFWMRCDTLKDRAEFLLDQLAAERRHCASQASELLELRAALRAERFHVEQLERQIKMQE